MSTNHDDRSDDNKLSPTDDRLRSNNERRDPPVFSGFDEDDEEGFEEPDRDTDFSSGYDATSVDEENTDDFLLDEDDSGLFSAPAAGSGQEPESIWEEPEPTEHNEPAQWQDKENTARDWPLGLIAVAIIALLLLVIGGYGVIQQRSATQEELRQLRAALATAANPDDVSASRAALQALKDANAELTANAEALTLYNRRLTDTVAGLGAQLEAQEAALTKTTASAKESTKPAATPKPVTPQPTAPQPAISANTETTAGDWFVNFGSYAVPAMAETWATRLRPTDGRVIIAKSTKDGKTIYRVRVVDLTSKGAAKEVARNLETAMGVSALWVGSD